MSFKITTKVFNNKLSVYGFDMDTDVKRSSQGQVN